MNGKIILLCLMAAVAAGFQQNCQYQLDQCYGRMHGIEQKVNQIEAQQNVLVGRQSAVTQALTKEVTMLDQDTKTVKSVVNTLVEDNVRMNGDIRLLKGHGDAIVGLRKQVKTVKESTEGEISGVKRKVNEVSQSLHQESEAVNKVTVLMSNQMAKNDRSLQELKAKTQQLESKINTVEQKAGGGRSDNVKGMVDELTSRLDSLQDNYNSQIQRLTDQINELNR